MQLQKYTKEWLEQLCSESYSLAEVLRKANRKPTGGNYEILKMKIRDYNIDISHFTGKLWNKGKCKEDDDRISSKEQYQIDDIFTKNSKVTRKVIRGYILRNHLIEYQCAFCGNEGEWIGKPIALELDHIDGDNTNNELDNLRFLCPNCHATTSTYRGKNKKCITNSI